MSTYYSEKSRHKESYGTAINVTSNSKSDPFTMRQANQCRGFAAEYAHLDSMPPINLFRLCLVIGVGFLTVFSIAYQYHAIKTVSPATLTAPSDFSIEDKKFSLRRLGYDTITLLSPDKSEYIQYKALKQYDAIIEPYSSMMLSTGAGKDILQLGVNFHFRICKESADGKSCDEGRVDIDWSGNDNDLSDAFQPLVISCRPYETFNITVHAIDPATSTKIGTTHLSAICIYVRRDIETLTNEDLAETMDAMYALWEYEEYEGQSLYGEGFHSALYFSEMHFFGAAQSDTDHIHEVLTVVS